MNTFNTLKSQLPDDNAESRGFNLINISDRNSQYTTTTNSMPNDGVDVEKKINLNDFLDFLKLSCHVNDMIRNNGGVQRKVASGRGGLGHLGVESKLNPSPSSQNQLEFHDLAQNQLVNELLGRKNKTRNKHSNRKDDKVKNIPNGESAHQQKHQPQPQQHQQQQQQQQKTQQPQRRNTIMFNDLTPWSQSNVNNNNLNIRKSGEMVSSIGGGSNGGGVAGGGLHPKLHEKLDFVINEGVLDAVLPFICPVPVPTKSRFKGKPNEKTATDEGDGIVNPTTDLQGKVIKETERKTKSNASFNASAPGLASGMTLGNDKKENDVIIHVCDEVKKTSRDFVCNQKLLVSKMGYFANVTAGQKLEDMDISVHCDIQIFEWLMRWIEYTERIEQNQARGNVSACTIGSVGSGGSVASASSGSGGGCGGASGGCCSNAKDNLIICSSATNLPSTSIGGNAHASTNGLTTTPGVLGNHTAIANACASLNASCGKRCSSQSMSSVLQPIDEPPQLDATNVVPILVSANFLQMEPLLLDCLTFCHSNLSEVVRVSSNLTCLNDTIVTRLAAMFTNMELEMVRDKKERITPRLWIKLIQSLCEPEPEALRGHYYSVAGLFRCAKCGKCITNTLKNYISCSPSNITLNRWGQMVNNHVRDTAWDLSHFISQLFKELKSWRRVYWRLWAHSHFLYCVICESHFQIYQMHWCRYHSESAQYLGPHVEGRMAGPLGRFPCCSQQAFRFETISPNDGCCLREHSVLVESDRERAILSIVQLLNDSSAVLEYPSLRAQDLTALGEKEPRWIGIAQIPHQRRLGLLPTIHFEKQPERPVRRTRYNGLTLTESSTETDTSPTGSPKHQRRSGRLRNSHFTSSSEDCDMEHGTLRSVLWRASKKRGTDVPEIPGRYWSCELSARSNQDHQRQFEEKVMKQISSVAGKKTGSEHIIAQHAAPMGGTYVRLEAEWRDQLRQMRTMPPYAATTTTTTTATATSVSSLNTKQKRTNN